MKQKRKVQQFLNELIKMFESKNVDHPNARANIWRVIQELKKITDRQDPNWEKELDDVIMQTLWTNLRFVIEGRSVTGTDHGQLAWLIYEIVRES
jgi:hypothetical protein